MKKAHQVYVRGDEEKVKVRARIMAQFLQLPTEKVQGAPRPKGRRLPLGFNRNSSSPVGGGQPRQQLGRNQCGICRKKREH